MILTQLVCNIGPRVAMTLADQPGATEIPGEQAVAKKPGVLALHRFPGFSRSDSLAWTSADGSLVTPTRQARGYPVVRELFP